MSEAWTEAERASWYAQQSAARQAADHLRCTTLRGNEAAAASVHEHWFPIVQFQQEQRRYEHQRPEETPDPACPIVN